MILNLYKNASDERKLNKSLISQGEANFTFKGDVNNLSPTLEMTLNDALKQSNYIFIPFLNRYYFIRSLTFNSNFIATVNCEVDVLMSHRSAIENLNVIASRSTNRYNLYITDNEFITQNNQQVQIKLFSEKPFNPTSLNDITNCFILQVARGGTV